MAIQTVLYPKTWMLKVTCVYQIAIHFKQSLHTKECLHQWLKWIAEKQKQGTVFALKEDANKTGKCERIIKEISSEIANI